MILLILVNMEYDHKPFAISGANIANFKYKAFNHLCHFIMMYNFVTLRILTKQFECEIGVLQRMC